MAMQRAWAFIVSMALALMATDVGAVTVAQGTSFTYQGQLTANGAPQAGQTYQFTFTLYDAASSGNALGTPIQQSILVGGGGLFTTDLDFGQIFNGTQYWLEIKVGTTIANEQPLATRQPINTVPVAQYALNSPPDTFAEFYHTDNGGAFGAVYPGDAIPFSADPFNQAPASGSPIIGVFGFGFPDIVFTGFMVPTGGTYEVAFAVSTGVPEATRWRSRSTVLSSPTPGPTRARRHRSGNS